MKERMPLARYRVAQSRRAFIRGSMTTDEVEAEKLRFNTDRNCRVIFITKAAKYGHTLLGDQSDPKHACSTEVFFENTYSLTTGRSWRIAYTATDKPCR